jgi:hypothetical protein
LNKHSHSTTNPEPRSLKVFSFVFIIPPFKILLA